MKLKIIKNNKLCKKDCLQELIGLYKQIMQALFLIIKDSESFPKQFFTVIVPGIQTQERQRKKQAERNFFVQTLNIYSNYKKLRKVVKKYQIYMRFSCISAILLQKFACLIHLKEKKAFIKQYQDTTESIKSKIYSWMKIKNTNTQNQSHSLSNLKYICSNELTLPSTTASRIGSAMAKMYEKYFNLESADLTNNQTHLQENFDESIHCKKKERCNTASVRRQKTKIQVGQPFKKGKKLIRSPSAPPQRKLYKKETEVVTEKQKQQKHFYKRRPFRKNAKLIPNNQNDSKIESHEILINSNVNKDKKQIKGRTSIHNNIAIDQSEESDDQKTKLEEAKKSDYFSSQNYMSRKTLDSGFGGTGKLKRMASLNSNIDFAYGINKTKTLEDDADKILQSKESIGSGAQLRTSYACKHKKLLSGSQQSISIEEQNENIEQDNNILQSQKQISKVTEQRRSRNSGRISKLRVNELDQIGLSKFNQSGFKKQNNKKLDPAIQHLRQMEAQFKKYSANALFKEDFSGVCSYLQQFQKECKEETYYENGIQSAFFKQQHFISQQQKKAKERYFTNGANRREFIARQILLDQTKEIRNYEEQQLRKQLFEYSQSLPFKKASKHQLIQIELNLKQDKY